MRAWQLSCLDSLGWYKQKSSVPVGTLCCVLFIVCCFMMRRLSSKLAPEVKEK